MTAFRAYRSLLSNGNLTRLLAGEFISSVGDWLYLVALLIVVYAQSQDAVLLGVVGAARVLPYVVLSVPAGILADRVDRRLLLISTDAARAVIMVVIALVVANNGPIAAVVALAILATCFSTFFGPTIGAYLPSLVQDERQLGPANSAYASLDNVAFVIGPALAGVLIATTGLAIAFLLNALSFLIVGVILWRLPSSRGALATSIEPSAAAETEVTQITDARPTDPRKVTWILVGLGGLDVIAGFAFGGVSVLTVVLSSSVYGSGEQGTGYLNAAMGIGGLLGAVVSGVLVLRSNLAPTLMAGGIAMGAGVAALGAVGSLVAGMVALTVATAGSLVLEVVSTTIFQRGVPNRIRGRSLGVMATTTTLAFAVGSFAIPVLSDAFGVQPVLGVSGLAVALGAAGSLWLVGDAARRAPTPYDATLARVAVLPIFAGVSPARLEAALRALVPRPVKTNEVVIRQGDVADRFYIIQLGRFRVTQHEVGGAEERVLREMGPDEVFGEIGLLRESPRTATVTALDDGLLLALDRSDFLRLVSVDSLIGSRLLDLGRGSGMAELRAEGGVVSAS